MSYIATYGGPGLTALNKALANNMTIRQASAAGANQGLYFWNSSTKQD